MEILKSSLLCWLGWKEGKECLLMIASYLPSLPRITARLIWDVRVNVKHCLWAGLDWTGLDWDGLGWTGMDQVGG